MTFEIAIERVLAHEGGYVNDPRDRGGETKFGISKRAHPELDIKAITRERAKAIYRADYWDPLPLEHLSGAAAFQLFDFAVHHGPRAAIAALQRAIGVKGDGVVGNVTIAALRNARMTMRAPTLAMLIVAERLDAQTHAPTWNVHGRGWVRRAAANLRYVELDERGDSEPV